uniref:Uncharacterized protein n=1 Tax=Pyxicephalus adspersus TaxID=30357 RepID=A0AAV3ATC0_PYXAD|nr:TPA: hypothetical protein GDO54_005988 [Pyxicephalus adspersus]
MTAEHCTIGNVWFKIPPNHSYLPSMAQLCRCSKTRRVRVPPVSITGSLVKKGIFALQIIAQLLHTVLVQSIAPWTGLKCQE